MALRTAAQLATMRSPSANAAIGSRPHLDLVSRLRAAIADPHQKIEATALVAAMVAGSIARVDYLTLLDRLAPVHAAFERRFVSSRLRALFPASLVLRDEALRSDVLVLRGHALVLRGDGPLPRTAPCPLATWLEAANESELVGAGYVIAGSSLGSTVLRPLLAKALAAADQPGHGLDYHRVQPDVLRQAWPALLERLELLPADAWTPAEDGAHTMMTGMLAIYASVG